MTRELLLLSDKSSGSTILEYELLKHSKIEHVKYTSHQDHETLYWLKAAVLLKKSKYLFFGGKYPFPVSYAKTSIAKFLKYNGVETKKIESIDDINLGWSKLSKKKNKILFEKSPHHLNHRASIYIIADYVNKNKDVKVIGLVRDPRSVIHSTLKRWYANPYNRQYKWLYSYENLFLFESLISNKNQLIKIRYEDLIVNPKRILKKVLNHIDIDWEEGIGDGIHQNSKEKWKSNNFDFQLSNEVIQLSKLFGYKIDEVDSSQNTFKFKFSFHMTFMKFKVWLKRNMNYFILKK